MLVLALLLLLIVLGVVVLSTRQKRLRVAALLLFLLLLPVGTHAWDCENGSTADRFDHLRYYPKQTVGAMTRAQQTYYVEHGQFSASLQPLGLGVPPTNDQFVYTTRATPKAAFQYGTTRPDCRLCEASLYDWIPFLTASCHSGPCFRANHCQAVSYAGVVFVTRAAGAVTTKTVLCEGKAPGTVPLNPTYRNGVVDCGEGAKPFG
ncbi:MAG: type IV pilin-like G/H family protein (plasmid) [Leptolyngbya sp. BL-A-14]